jgi:hypothetical protein
MQRPQAISAAAAPSSSPARGSFSTQEIKSRIDAMFADRLDPESGETDPVERVLNSTTNGVGPPIPGTDAASMACGDEMLQVEHVIDRLIAQYPSNAPVEIENLVRTIHKRFANGRIRDFVPLLVEKAARRHLNDSDSLLE